MSQQKTLGLDKPTYGNIIVPSNTGFWGFPKDLSNIAIVFVIMAFLSQVVVGMINQNLAIATTALIVISGVATIVYRIRRGKFGRYKYQEQRLKKAFLKAKKAGKTKYRPGPASEIPDGSYRAPGPLMATELKDWISSRGDKWAMLWNGVRRTGTVWFSVSTSGLQLRDQDDINNMVDAWAAFHRQTGVQGTILQVAVSTVSTTDSGYRLPLAVDNIRKHARGKKVAAAANATLDEVVAIENTALPRIEHLVTLTFSARAEPAFGISARSDQELAEEILTVIDGFKESLAASARGSVSLMSYQDVTDYVYSTFNPGQAKSVDIARQNGGTGLRWEEAGPTYHNVEKNFYEHSGYYSKTLQMWKPPASVFYEDSMMELLAPDQRIAHKRVTILYRPLPPDISSQKALEVVNNAKWKVGQKKRKATSEDKNAAAKAEKTETEMGLGATLVPFSLLVTITVDDPAKFPQLTADTNRRGGSQINVRLREAEYSQDFSFALSLGAGAVPNYFKE